MVTQIIPMNIANSITSRSYGISGSKNKRQNTILKSSKLEIVKSSEMNEKKACVITVTTLAALPVKTSSCTG